MATMMLVVMKLVIMATKTIMITIITTMMSFGSMIMPVVSRYDKEHQPEAASQRQPQAAFPINHNASHRRLHNASHRRLRTASHNMLFGSITTPATRGFTTTPTGGVAKPATGGAFNASRVSHARWG